ncbi:MAG: NAD(P)H-hydrate dehydratase, partial [Gammaproteobacteria bacterium]
LRPRPTVLTPHPLEAGRLLGCTAAQVQADRLRASRELVQRFGCVVVLKGSGTLIAGPGRTPLLNPTGNARLATAGTGDVLAGLLASRLAATPDPFDAAAAAVYEHGRLADDWSPRQALTASLLSQAVAPHREPSAPP